MTRIALVGSQDEFSLERFYQHALTQQGHQVVLFEPDASFPKALAGRVRTRLTWSLRPYFSGRALLDFFQRDPSWDAVIVFKGLFLPARVIEQCMRLTGRARWGNINPDSPFAGLRVTTNRHVSSAIPLYDHYFIWSRNLLAPLRAAGARAVSYLPFGYAEQYHRPAVALDPALSGVISFVGTYDKTRARVLEPLADLPLQVFGNGWERLPLWSKLRRCVQPGALHGEPLRRVVSSSLANINNMRAQNVGAHNMRTFEVPAMRGLLLTTRSPEQHGFFPEGKASLMYEGPRELRTRLEELLRGKHDVATIRARAYELAQAHSYGHRARELMAKLLA
jgi:hypothetical protein